MKCSKGLKAGVLLGSGFVMLVLLVALFALISELGMSFWLLLAVAPGVVILVSVLIYYRSYPSSEAKPDTFGEPFSRYADDSLQRFQRNTIEQLADISAVLSSQQTTSTKAEHITGQLVVANEAEVSINPRISDLAATQRSAGPAQEFAQLADKMQYLADLTTHLLERRQTLTRTAIEPRMTVKGSTLDSQYLSFTLNGMPFAVSMLNVHVLMEATQLIPKPGLSAQSRRAVRLGSSLVPVMDLGVHFGGNPITIGRSTNTSIIIVEVPVGDHWQRVGVVADSVGRILDIPWGQIEEPTTSGDGIGNEFVLGTATVSNQRVTLLDIERALLASESVVLRALPRPAEQQELPT